MKIYDKEIYEKSEKIKSILIILFVFTVSFIAGFKICEFEKDKIIEEKQNKIDEQFIELDSLRESIYMYQVYGK